VSADIPSFSDLWQSDGSKLERVFEFPTFRRAVGFVVEAALAAERSNHHPDIDIRYRKVRVVLTTHSAGGLTEKDYELAAKLDAAVGA
jgi:4a-hydroxytetrahydrobiopterin dehydratase